MFFTASFISRIIPAGLLTFAGLSKLYNLTWFYGVLRQFEIVRPNRIRIVGITVVALEILIGSLLFVNFVFPLPEIGALVLFAVFTWVITDSLLHGKLDIECGCIGPWRRRKVGYVVLLRNISLMGMTTLSFLANGQGWSVGSAIILCLLVAAMVIPAFA